jgi:ribosome-binding ATPase YchF (GTP1/OBG family)
MIEFVDIAGLVRGASKGEGLGNKFLSHIREVDAIVHVVRCFEDNDIVHVDGDVNPARDIETIRLELVFSDIEVVERRIDAPARPPRAIRRARPRSTCASACLLTVGRQAARGFSGSDEEQKLIFSYGLLSAMPVIYAANLSDTDFSAGLSRTAGTARSCASPRRKARKSFPSARARRRKSPRSTPRTGRCFSTSSV